MLELVPVTLREANGFVQQYHRHHKQVAGHKFSIGVAQDGKLVGVAICGRPVSRRLDNGTTLEVNRLCTDGTRNACSILYPIPEDLRRYAERTGMGGLGRFFANRVVQKGWNRAAHYKLLH